MEKNNTRDFLKKLHQQENNLNKEMGKIDKQIKLLEKKKVKLAGMISSNMKLRNRQINKL